jgi:tetratricopeptide (TPR) repeat protein
MAPTASSYDLFLSYSSEDHDVVEPIARKLRDEGLEPFLDRWYLAPGARWRSKLEDTLSSCKAVAIFVGPGEMGSWQQREVDVALDLQSRNPNLPVIPVLLPGCEPPLGFLRQLTWVDLRSEVLERGIAILIKAACGEAPGPDLQRHFDFVRASICPYRGLLHFREEDAPFFFGREAAIEGLVEAIKHHPFLALVGASGSGKSSVVRAGLVPRLRSDRGTTWEFISLVPTDQPLKALATALVPFLEPTKSEVDRLDEAGKLAGLFAGGTVSLYDVVRRILEKQRGTDRVLIFVDQFEELYTLVQDDAGRRKFADELITSSTLSHSKLTVAITLRGDFVGKAFAYRTLSDRLQGAQINLGPMTRQELTSVIRKPAEKLQLNFEAGLVERILDAVGDEPGNLPLLEFVLRELWEKRRGGLLLNESYDIMGELKGALAKKADDFFAHLSPAERNILQRVFLRLVSPADGGQETRRRAAFKELPLEAIDLVDKLAKERLLVTNASSTGAAQTVEVAHEALISNWVTLRAWVNEDREFLFWRKRLEGLLCEWDGVGKDEGALLRGPLLIEAQSWFDKRSQDLSEEERSFINASRALRDRLEREEKKRREKELEDAEKRAKEQKEAASKLRRLAWVLAAVALVAVGGAIFGFWQKNEAEIRKHAVEVANAEAKRQEAIAKENANKEKISRNAAEEQAQIANDARDQADDLINFMLDDLRNKLLPIGRVSILDAVVTKAKQYLDRLPKDLLTKQRLREQEAMLRNLGDVLVLQGKLEDAMNVYRYDLTIAKQLADQDEANADLKRDLSLGYNKVGDVLEVQGKLQQALDAYKQGLDIRQSLADQNKSNPAWQRDLSVSYERIGNLLVAQGKLREALEAYQQSLNIRQTLANQDRSNAGWQGDLSVSYGNVGDVLSTQGKLREALEAYQQEQAIAKRLADAEKSNAVWQRALSVSNEKIGDVLITEGKLNEALDVYQQSLKIRQTLVDQDKSNTGWQQDLSVGYAKVGDALSTQNNLPEALEAYQEELAIAERLADQDSSNVDWQRNLAVSHEKIGNVLAAQGKFPEALGAYQQELAITKRLVDEDTSNAGWQQVLAVSYEKVGDVLEKEGDLREALDAYQQELVIAKRPAEMDESNAAWQRIRIVSIYKVGTCMAKTGGKDNMDQAQSLLRTGLEWAELYSGQDRPERINDFTQALAKLGH